MKVLYDYQTCLNQRFGGISRYFFELTQRFEKTEGIDTKLICLFNDNAYFTKNKSEQKPFRGRRFLNRTVTKLLLRFSDYDIFHPTYYDTYFLSRYKGKLVLTVYDMIHELMPEYFPGDETSKNKKLLIDRADRIIAISESTKHDIIKLYPDVNEDKIEVIYIGSNFKVSDVKFDSRFPDNYVLFVGNRDAYKNYANFWRSMEPIMKADETLHLVCLGGGRFKEEELERQKKYSNRIIQMNVNDKTLSYAYSHAKCFVFPSLYEGFGIPTLEAFACECPVILSNTSSMPEVGGDAVEYINPYNISDMTKKIEHVIYSDYLRENMVEKGKKQLKKFNWDDIAKQTLECYKNVLKD